MPLVAVAVCPHPPVLIPEIARGAAAELAPLRAACDAAVASLIAAEPDEIHYLGSGPDPSGAELGRPDLPLSLAVGQWLVNRAAAAVAAAGSWVPRTSTVDECVTIGRQIAATPRRIALLVLGDGSACRGPKSPGYDDAGAEPFDATVAAALAEADVAGLGSLDRALADRLLCAGWAPWQVLAAAVAADGRQWSGSLSYRDAPYGVAYFVATWFPTRQRTAPIMNSSS